ncbi:hypothetical protein P5V15_008635 [Pogonomyrmex californicus]
MLARRLTFAFGKQLRERSCFPDNSLTPAARSYGVDHEKRQYEWRESEHNAVTTQFGDDPEKPKTIMWFPTAARKETDFSLSNIVKWYKHRKVIYTKANQAFIPERHKILGADLATAHFILFRGGRVKFKNNTLWTEQDEKGLYQLPESYDPHYILEAVDMNGFDLHYEGLSNLCGLVKLKWLSLKGCKNIDDWGLDKISAEFPELEYLDISGCEKISERGLESLYRMISLKKLIATNYHNSVAFELTCFMLEDCMPGLSCEILTPEEKTKD